MAHKKLVGTIINNHLPKTVTVQISYHKKNAKYGKNVARQKKVLAHLADGVSVKIGETVSLASCRPLSARKHFIVVKGEAK